MPDNRRKYPRLNIHVPVNYTLLDSRGKIESEFIGVALDVSLGGLLLQASDFVETEYVHIGFLDIENKSSQIKCKMVYSLKTDSGMVNTGLRFHGQETEKLEFVTRIIRAYFYQKKRLT